MIKEKDWNPELYLKFKNERTQPSIDLTFRINIENPENIVDVGCGPGNSTQILVQRWPDSQITGIDNSPGMIEKARSDYPNQKWVLSGAYEFNPDYQFDIVFSNATIQWIPNHETLIPKLLSLVKKNGALAVQLPQFRNMPVGIAIENIADNEKWKELMLGCKDLYTFHEYGYYYELLQKHVNKIDLWETSYFHILDSHYSILEWIRSAGVKPYLDRLESENDKKTFENELMVEIKKLYPGQDDKKVIFPFKRLFFIAYK
jgi:trans-aconitate 2-methyltransferase